MTFSVLAAYIPQPSTDYIPLQSYTMVLWTQYLKLCSCADAHDAVVRMIESVTMYNNVIVIGWE